MLGITTRFINIAIVFIIAFVLVKLFYYFKFKRDVNLSDVDKALWQLRLSTVFLAVLIFVAMVYLLSTGFYGDIDLSPSARETAFKDLVWNQQRMGNELDELKEVLFIVFMWLMLYLFGAGDFVGRLWRERQRLASANNPAIKKPLGLETD